MQLPRRGRIWIATVCALGMAVAGCSSSGGSDDSGTSAGPTGSTSAPSGTPITIGSFASLNNPAYSTPQSKAGMVAAVDAVNAAGGVAGHKLVLNFCDTNYEASKEVSCTRQLIKDKVSALVAPSILADPSGQEYKLAEAAKVAVIGGEGLTPAELNSPVTFPLSSGIPGWVYGAVEHLLDSGATKIAIVDDTNPASTFFGGLAAAALKSAGATPVATVTADPKSDPTLATAAGKTVSSHADGIILCPSPQNTPKFVKALDQAGYDGKISSITALFAPPIIKALGAAADGILLTSQVAFVTDTSNAGIKQFQAEMAQYQPDAVIDESTLISWAAVKLFAQVASGLSDFDAPSILAAFEKLSQPVDLKVAGPFAVEGQTSPVPDFSRIFNPTVQNGTVQDGKVVADGKGFINPFEALAQNG